jgi:replicative DNA helicase
MRSVNESAENSTPENEKAHLMLLRDVLGDLRRDADAAHEARKTGQPRGAISGLSTLDRELSGAFAPGVHFIHGNAGAGKTAFALQTAADCQSPAMFVTCEMAPAELLRRHTARATKTYLGRLKSGEMSGADAEALALRAIEAAPDLAFVDATRAAAPLAFLYDSAQIVKRDAKHLLIVIDSLHSWAQGLASNLPEYEALNVGVSDLQRLAARLGCAILIVSERNRASMKDGGINAGAGTRKIEYGAETVLDLDKDADAQADGAGEENRTLRISKNRHGAAGKPIVLKWHGALQTFRELDTGEKVEAAVHANSASKTARGRA